MENGYGVGTCSDPDTVCTPQNVGGQWTKTCVACGQPGQACCAGGGCTAGYNCTGQTPGTCTFTCGREGQPVCPDGTCDPGFFSNGSKCHETYCGMAGQPCCTPYTDPFGNIYEHPCDEGACYAGECLTQQPAPPQTTCGSAGQYCCDSADSCAVGDVCDTSTQPPSTQVCRRCGGLGEIPCYPFSDLEQEPSNRTQACNEGLGYNGTGKCGACGQPGQACCSYARVMFPDGGEVVSTPCANGFTEYFSGTNCYCN